jgi:hypothetical protein
MNMKIKIFLVFVIAGLIGCNQLWEEHYEVTSETIDKNVWDALQGEGEVSSYLQELKNFDYDTLFNTTSIFTLFVPTNAAMEEYKSGNEVDRMLLDYLITPHFVQSENIKGTRKIQTLGKKFILFENANNSIRIDGVEIILESPLYRNGKFYIIDKVAEVRPNLYEYYAVENPILKDYIDAQDSLILDKGKSNPIGFNDDGQIIYDTVANIYNEFEESYFPVRQESRYETATIIFPKSDDYNNALTEMAQNMNAEGVQDYRDIPLDWQNRILMPLLLKQGIFENMLEPEEFISPPFPNKLRLKNIQGDTIPITYTPVDKTICSNGYAYNYENFYIPDTLYMNPSVLEAEHLLRQTGVNKFTWIESVKAQSDLSFIPNKLFSNGTSNDSILSVLFPKGYTGNFSVEFNMPAQFPRKYILIITTNMYYGGIYDIYVNDELAGSFDYYDFIRFRGYNYSSVTGERYFPKGNFNKFDVLVDNLTEYSQVKVKFVYTGPGDSFDNGFIVDFFSLKPYNGK